VTDRKTASTINDAELDQLYDQLDRLAVVRKAATRLLEHNHDAMSARWILGTIGSDADEPARTTPMNSANSKDAP